MADEKKEKKSGKKSILTIILTLVVLGAGSFAGVYLYMNKTADKEVVIEEAFFEVGEIFVNLSDKERKSYAKLNLSISYDKTNKNLPVELEEKKVVVRDTVIYYLKSCTTDSFTPSNEEALKKELTSRINSKLKDGTIINVYISEIMVQ